MEMSAEDTLRAIVKGGYAPGADVAHPAIALARRALELDQPPCDEICIGSTTSGRVVFTVGDRTVASLSVEDALRASLCLHRAIQNVADFQNA